MSTCHEMKHNPTPHPLTLAAEYSIIETLSPSRERGMRSPRVKIQHEHILIPLTIWTEQLQAQHISVAKVDFQ